MSALSSDAVIKATESKKELDDATAAVVAAIGSASAGDVASDVAAAVGLHGVANGGEVAVTLDAEGVRNASKQSALEDKSTTR